MTSPPEPLYILRGHQFSVHPIRWSPATPDPGGSSHVLVSGDAGGRINLWDTSSRRTISSWLGHNLEPRVVSGGGKKTAGGLLWLEWIGRGLLGRWVFALVPILPGLDHVPVISSFPSETEPWVAAKAGMVF